MSPAASPRQIRVAGSAALFSEPDDLIAVTGHVRRPLAAVAARHTSLGNTP
jgi:hypothetical protein